MLKFKEDTYSNSVVYPQFILRFLCILLCNIHYSLICKHQSNIYSKCDNQRSIRNMCYSVQAYMMDKKCIFHDMRNTFWNTWRILKLHIDVNNIHYPNNYGSFQKSHSQLWCLCTSALSILFNICRCKLFIWK